MPITQHLNGEVFQPEETQVMGIALTNACKALNLAEDKSDPLTQIIAAKIIELARHGEQDHERLCAAVLAIYKSIEK
jgi:PIN domain nuclease of toxin-antitoxin system